MSGDPGLSSSRCPLRTKQLERNPRDPALMPRAQIERESLLTVSPALISLRLPSAACGRSGARRNSGASVRQSCPCGLRLRRIGRYRACRARPATRRRGCSGTRGGFGLPIGFVISFVLHYAGAMARPRGRTKPARLTVNLDRPTYASLVELARREDVSISWVVRRAIETLLARDRTAPVGPALASSADSTDRRTSGEMTPQ